MIVLGGDTFPSWCPPAARDLPFSSQEIANVQVYYRGRGMVTHGIVSWIRAADP